MLRQQLVANFKFSKKSEALPGHPLPHCPSGRTGRSARTSDQKNTDSPPHTQGQPPLLISHLEYLQAAQEPPLQGTPQFGWALLPGRQLSSGEFIEMYPPGHSHQHSIKWGMGETPTYPHS